MKIKVEACWGGREITQRLTTPNGLRLIIRHERFGRAAATDALNLLAAELPHVPRKSIRFDVH